MDDPQDDNPHSSVHTRRTQTIIALAALLVFLGALGYSYGKEKLPALLSVFNQARSLGAERMQSQYFDIRNSSDATPGQIRLVVRELEGYYESIRTVIGRAPEGKLPLLFVNGTDVAVLDASQLVVSFDRGAMNTITAPFFLVFQMEEQTWNEDTNLFLSSGYALYVTEQAGISGSMLRTPSPELAAMLRKEDSYWPLAEAWTAVMPTDEDGMYHFARGMVEGGAFIGWFVERYGLEAARQLLNGAPIEEVCPLTLAQAESAWLADLEQQVPEAASCRSLMDSNSPLAIICRKPNESSGQ